MGPYVASGSKPIAGSYPKDLVCDEMTRAGLKIHLRPIRNTDSGRLFAFHEHLSPRSVYRRHFFVHPTLSEAEVEHFTNVDYVHRMALIAEDGDQLIAVGRYEQTPGTAEAEVAFVVSDAYQNIGIGTLLLAHLAPRAWRCGIETFVASVLAENRAMLDVFLHSGFRITTGAEFGTVEVRFGLEPENA